MPQFGLLKGKMELAIDTSSETASIALAEKGEVRAELTWHCGRNHTAELMPNLTHLLSQAKASLETLSGVIVARGPGSFNGLRAGMATAKGLAFALSIPLIGIGTLEVEALPHATRGLPICSLFDAGRGEVAAALFHAKRGKLIKIQEEHITTLEALCPQITRRTLFCGRITAEMSSQIEKLLGRRALVLRGGPFLRRAGFLAALGWRRLERGDHDDPATLQPLYLRRPAITMGRK